MSKIYPWLQFDWPLESGGQIKHESLEDLRKFIWLATIGRNAIGGKTSFEEDTFAGTFDDALTDYSSAITPNWLDEQIEKPGTTLPGSLICYHEYDFSASCGGVSTDTDAKGEFIVTGCTSVTKNGIFNSNPVVADPGTTLTPASETWYKEQDDFRKGTPFVVSGCANAANDGFYRVRSTRMSGTTLYITVDNNNFEQQELAACSSGGTLACDFGGDWYCLIGAHGNSSDTYQTEGGKTIKNFFSDLPDAAYLGTYRDKWWSQKDFYHRYADNARGPYDGRPPSGGQYSIDFNQDWVRCPNPNLYHTYDTNGHRYYIFAESKNISTPALYEQFVTIFESSKFLNKAVDPKEVESPKYYADTKSLRWKYKEKVALQISQITNPDKLGPIQACFENGYTTGTAPSLTHHPQSNARQYGSVWVDDDSQLSLGIRPHGGDYQHEDTYNSKYDESLQVMVELACEESGWVYPVTSTYITNWLDLNKDQIVNYDFQIYLNETYDEYYTYEDAVTDHGTSAYDPLYNADQPSYAYMSDELFGENGSAFELILSELGTSYYDWFYDDTTPYTSKRILDARWYFIATEDPDDWTFPITVNGISCANLTEVCDAKWPLPVGTWRRTWKYSFGRVRNAGMRDVGRGDPTFQTYASYSDGAVPMYGHIRMAAPSDSDCYSWSDTGTVDGDSFTVDGDVRTHYVQGCKVWAVVSDEYKAYHVKRVSYISGDTIVYLGDDFESDAPTTLYGDISIADRHDSIIFESQYPKYGENIVPILNSALEVLKKLQYKEQSVSLSSYRLWAAAMEGYGVEYDTFGEAVADEQASLDAQWDDDPENWSAYDLFFVGYLAIFSYNKGTYKWYSDVEGVHTHRIEYALKIASSFDFDHEAVSFVIALRARKYDEYFCGNYDTGSVLLGITGVETITIPDQVEEWQNVCVPVYAKEDSSVWIRLRVLSDITDVVQVSELETVYGSTFATHRLVELEYGSPNLFFWCNFDWSKYSDLIWARTKERSDYGLIDPYGYDTRPPVVVNEWFSLPELYDAALPDVGTGNPYESDSFESTFKIRGASVLMEDREDNGVSYLFNFNPDETYPNKMDKTLTDRKYDVTLDMDTGSTAGDHDDSWKAFDEDFEDWTITLNTKDNYSSRGLGESDNYNTALAAQAIKILPPMFPVKGRFVSGSPILVKVTEDSTDHYYWLVVLDEVLPGDGYSSVVNEFQINYGTTFDDDGSPFGTGPNVSDSDLPSAFVGKLKLWIPDDSISAVYQGDWRVRYKTGYTGIWSEVVTVSTSGMLEIDLDD